MEETKELSRREIVNKLLEMKKEFNQPIQEMEKSYKKEILAMSKDLAFYTRMDIESDILIRKSDIIDEIELLQNEAKVLSELLEKI